MSGRIVAAAAAVAAVVAFSAPASAATPFKVGVLKCKIAGGIGWVFGSSKDLTCVFDPAADGKPNEEYTGSISRFGIDIGVTEKTEAVWGVLAVKEEYSHGSLAGHYGGVSAEATFGVGLGANVLIGGFDKSFALQPVSVQGQVGADISAGIAELDLTFVK